MRQIKDIHQQKKSEGKPAFSFEFFPPKTEKGEEALFGSVLPELQTMAPDYCSVTYGAGGSTRDKTLDMVERIQKDFGLVCMSHLTCVQATKEQIAQVLQDAEKRNIRNILALRGDPPGGVGPFEATEGGFAYSKDLVAFIRAHHDWGRLKEKVDAGADFVVTQLFFDNEDFLRFRDHMVKKLGMHQTLIPGILPVLSTRHIQRFTELCGASIPTPMMQRLEDLSEDDAAAAAFGIEYAVGQCEELLKEGVAGLHFYCLNKAHSTLEVARALASHR
ncbi:MAG: methylenetetrahydrofolate reductase [Limisphaerales bacterium]